MMQIIVKRTFKPILFLLIIVVLVLVVLKVNSMDILTIMQLMDYNEITQNTLDEIKNDFPNGAGMFSVNCIFRYLLFEQKKYMNEYLGKVAKVGSHAGLIGLGEHYNTQHVNQTMSCFVFD